jgi:hypothetical protein
MPTSTLAVNLAGNFEIGPAVVAGLVGALAVLIVIYAGKAMGMTTMDLLKTLGTMVVPKAATNVVYAVGLMMHLMMGAVFGVIHAGLLHAVAPTTDAAAVGFGALFGGLHGALVVAMMPTMLTMMHPLVRSGDMAKPGVAMTGMGKMTPMGMLMGHIVFGVVTGSIYVAWVG